MIHVVAMKCLIGLPLLIRIELLRRSRSRGRRFKNRGVGVGAFVYRLHSPGMNLYRQEHVSSYNLYELILFTERCANIFYLKKVNSSPSIFTLHVIVTQTYQAKF
jgi:hypothetical protein